MPFIAFSLGQLFTGIVAGCFAVALVPFAIAEKVREHAGRW